MSRTQSDHLEKYGVSLSTWLDDCEEGLVSFSAWWLTQHKADPKRFPLKMLSHEWDEQMKRWGTAQECGVL